MYNRLKQQLNPRQPIKGTVHYLFIGVGKIMLCTNALIHI